jgi:hypothetical protein
MVGFDLLSKMDFLIPNIAGANRLPITPTSDLLVVFEEVKAFLDAQ